MEKVLSGLMKDDRFKLLRPRSKVSYSADLELLRFSFASKTSQVFPPFASRFTIRGLVCQ